MTIWEQGKAMVGAEMKQGLGQIHPFLDFISVTPKVNLDHCFPPEGAIITDTVGHPALLEMKSQNILGFRLR